MHNVCHFFDGAVHHQKKRQALLSWFCIKMAIKWMFLQQQLPSQTQFFVNHVYETDDMSP